MLSQGGTSLSALSIEEVDNARREARLLDQVAQIQDGERRLLGSFQNHSITCAKSWAELPSGHGEWEVPGDDLATDA